MAQTLIFERIVRLIEWARLPGDAVFIGLEVMPLVIAAGLTYKLSRNSTLKSDSMVSDNAS